MPLKNKHLKYSPEITLEIFTLVWSKLESLFTTRIYDWTKDWSLESFKKHGYISIWGNNDMYAFGINNNPGFGVDKETTVQEILGYDPFVKEEVIPEYVEYIKSDDVGKIAKVLKWSAASYCKVEFPNGTIKEPFKHLVRPSTKEAFDAQNKSKKLLSLNQWYQSGNHVVYLYERNKVYGFHHDKWFTSEGFSESDLKYVDRNTVEGKFTNYIKDNYSIGQSFVDLVNNIDFQIKSYDLNFGNNTTQIYISVEPNEVRGNKTARIFDKGIWANYSSTKSNKQAVHCKTQEEWDFVTKKLNRNNEWEEDYPCQILVGTSNWKGGVQFCIAQGIQILSFQEWCDLNEYKMEKEVKFEVGDYIILENAGGWSYSTCNNGCLGIIREIGGYRPIILDKYICSITGDILNSKNEDKTFKDIPIEFYQGKWIVRHATPEEINNHLISIGQIPAGEPLNIGIESNKDSAFKYTTLPGSSWSGGTIQNHLEAIIPTTGNCYNKDFSTSFIPVKPKMILSIDDEELPMISIIKTNSIKQLLNLE